MEVPCRHAMTGNTAVMGGMLGKLKVANTGTCLQGATLGNLPRAEMPGWEALGKIPAPRVTEYNFDGRDC